MLPHILALLTLLGFASHVAVVRQQVITTLSSAQIESFKPYILYAAVAYCQPSQVFAWSCGEKCMGNPTFQPYASGGDGALVQFWYVGWDPNLSSVIVAHQGTKPARILADMTDGAVIFNPLDSNLFPGLSSSIQVHRGFANDQASASSVVVTGHSLGAAIALLDSVYFRLHLPASTGVNMIGFGLPRVGNAAFVKYVDATLGGNVTHVNNKKDPIPILPGKFLGYAHPAGEIHIQASGAWDACPGRDNPSELCVVGDVPTVFQGKHSDHDGPYCGIRMGCSS